jgi:hypothetical protein
MTFVFRYVFSLVLWWIVVILTPRMAAVDAVFTKNKPGHIYLVYIQRHLHMFLVLIKSVVLTKTVVKNATSPDFLTPPGCIFTQAIRMCRLLIGLII